jgi:hypothetical protein
MKTLRERLADWHDFDGAAYELGVVLGLFPEFGQEPGQDPWHGTKGIFWSANPLGDVLNEMLHKLVEVGMLDFDDERFRWNPTCTVPNL